MNADSPHRFYVITNISWISAGFLIGFISSAWIGAAIGATLGGILSPLAFGRLKLRGVGDGHLVKSWATLRRQFGISLAASYIVLLGIFSFILYENYASENLISMSCIISHSSCEGSDNQFIIEGIKFIAAKIVTILGPSQSKFRTIPIVYTYMSLFFFSLIVGAIINICCSAPYLLSTIRINLSPEIMEIKNKPIKILLAIIASNFLVYIYILLTMNQLVSYEDGKFGPISRRIYASYVRIAIEMVFSSQIVCFITVAAIVSIPAISRVMGKKSTL